MVNRAVFKSLVPALVITVVIALSVLVPSRNVPFDGKLVSCVTYGYGYPPVAPTVTAVSPNQGPATGGTSVMITGTGFCNGAGATSVKFGATSAVSYVVNSDTSITAISPAGAGTVDVTVTTAGGTSATSAADKFTYVAFNCYFNWYDNATVGMTRDNIHIMNISGTATNVTVTMPGVSAVSLIIQPSGEKYVKFPSGTIGGPVTVSSDQKILASQRVTYNESFNETWCEDQNDADTTNYLEWFDNNTAGMYTNNIHVLNPGATTTVVTITLPGAPTQTVTLTAGAGGYATFPNGTIGGPVKITSTQPILGAQRVLFYQTFNEEPAQSPKKAQKTSALNWFDNATPGMTTDNIHIVNPNDSTATVTVTLGSVTKTVTVAAGAQTYTTFAANSIGGPVSISADLNVLASQRVLFNQSFNEVLSNGKSNAATTLRLMWYDTATAGMTTNNIHVLNTGASSATVTVNVPGYATVSKAIAAGTEDYLALPSGTIGGPVFISSTQPVLAAQRVLYFATFNEVPAQ